METWKPIPGYSKFYEASENGAIRRIAGSERCKTNRLIQPKVSRQGYLQISLSAYGIRRMFNVHQLVAWAFLGHQKVGETVNHINGNKSDNRVLNLEYLTQADNNRHARDELGVWVGENNGRSKLTENNIREIRTRTANGEQYTSLANEYGVSVVALRNAAIGKTWKHIK